MKNASELIETIKKIQAKPEIQLAEERRQKALYEYFHSLCDDYDFELDFTYNFRGSYRRYSKENQEKIIEVSESTYNMIKQEVSKAKLPEEILEQYNLMRIKILYDKYHIDKRPVKEDKLDFPTEPALQLTELSTSEEKVSPQEFKKAPKKEYYQFTKDQMLALFTVFHKGTSYSVEREKNKINFPPLRNHYLFDQRAFTPILDFINMDKTLIMDSYSLIQNEKSIYYELHNPKELKAIEISDDLYRAEFYFSKDKPEHQKGWFFKLSDECERSRYVVYCAVEPPLPEMGHMVTDFRCVEVYGMVHYSSMGKYNKRHISENYCISEQLHPLEWILTKARNCGVLPNELYERIRIDVRHRATQMQEIANANKHSSQQMLNEVRKRYSPDTNFKRITTSSDTFEFAGQVVAYVSDSYYFSNGEDAITFPVQVSEHKVRFAKVDNMITDWSGCEDGYDMTCFLKPEACGSAHALINSLIERDSILAMRLATIQELEFLKLTLELDQGRLGYRGKNNDVKMLENKIAQFSRAVEITKGHLPHNAPYSFFTARKSPVMPPFMPFTNGVVDWKQEMEVDDKSEPTKLSNIGMKKRKGI